MLNVPLSPLFFPASIPLTHALPCLNMPHYMPVLFLLLAPQAPAPSSPSEFVEQVSRTYGRLNSFSADFEQISQEPSNHRGVQRGHVYVKTGKSARVEYLSPE